MTKVELDKLIDYVWERQCEFMMTDGDVRPTIFLVRDDGQVRAMSPDAMASKHKKDLLASTIAKRARKDGAVAILMVSPAWIVVREPGAGPMELTCHDDPNRREVLSLSHESGGPTSMRMAEVLRSEDGKVLGFGETVEEEGFDGRFANLLHAYAGWPEKG